MSFKAFIVLALAAVALAAPNARRQAAGEPANCSYVLNPSTPVGSDANLVAEFNLGKCQTIQLLAQTWLEFYSQSTAIGRTIAIESPSHDTTEVSLYDDP